jgi:hypothetical protein
MLDLEIGTKHIRDSFALFGLKVHLGVRGGDKDGKDLQSKSLAMFFPKSQDRKNIPQVLQTGSYDLGDGTFVAFCTQFKYLGTTLTPDLDDTTEIERRISLAHWAFHNIRKTLCNQHLCVTLRRQLYQVCVLSILLAGCETWSTKDSHLSQLALFHNRCTRSMCGLTLWHCRMHKISTDNILREKLNLLPIEKIFYLRQLQFLHRVACMDPSRLTSQTLSSQAVRLPGMRMAPGRKTNTLSTWKTTLEKAGLTAKDRGGRFAEWIPKLRDSSERLIEQALDLPQGSFRFKPRPIHPHSLLIYGNNNPLSTLEGLEPAA